MEANSTKAPLLTEKPGPRERRARELVKREASPRERNRLSKIAPHTKEGSTTMAKKRSRKGVKLVAPLQPVSIPHYFGDFCTASANAHATRTRNGAVVPAGRRLAHEARPEWLQGQRRTLRCGCMRRCLDAAAIGA